MILMKSGQSDHRIFSSSRMPFILSTSNLILEEMFLEMILWPRELKVWLSAEGMRLMKVSRTTRLKHTLRPEEDAWHISMVVVLPVPARARTEVCSITGYLDCEAAIASMMACCWLEGDRVIGVLLYGCAGVGVLDLGLQ